MKRRFSVPVCIMTALMLLLTGCGRQAEGGGAGITERDSGEQGRYLEEALDISILKGQKQCMAALSDSGLAVADTDNGMFVTADQGKSFTGASVSLELMKNYSYPDSIAVSPEGGILYAQKKKEGGFFLYYRNDGESLKPFYESGAELLWPAFAPDGTLYTAELLGEDCQVAEIDIKTGRRRPVSNASAFPSMMAVTQERIYLVQKTQVEMIGRSSGQQEESDPVLDAFVADAQADGVESLEDTAVFLLPGQEETLYLACSGGLYRHVIYGSAMEQLIEGGQSRFGAADTYTRGLAELDNTSFLALFSDGSLVRYSYEENAPKKAAHTLKVYSLEKNRNVQLAVQRFSKEHPDVYVDYEIGLQKEGSATSQDAVKNLNTALLAGDGPDVIVFDGLNPSVYAKKGMLANLKACVEEVSAGRSFFSNVIYGTEEDGKLFFVPTRFQIPVMQGRQEELKSVDSPASLAACLKQMRERTPEGGLLETVTAEWTIRLLAQNNAGNWIADGKINREALTSFLEMAKPVYEAEAAGYDDARREEKVQDTIRMGRTGFSEANGVWEYTIADWSLYAALKNDMFVNREGVQMGILRNIDDFGTVGGFAAANPEYGIFAMPGEDGKILLPVMQAGVNSKSPEPELAMAFIALLLDEKTQSDWSEYGFPADASVLEKQLEDSRLTGGYSRSGENREGEVVNVEFLPPGQKETDALLTLVKESRLTVPPDDFLLEAVMEYGGMALTGQMSIEESVEQIADRTAIFLAEQE